MNSSHIAFVSESRLDCVISEAGEASSEIVERTKKLKIPLLAPEWIIQSLFVMEAVPMDNPKYYYEHSEQPTGHEGTATRDNEDGTRKKRDSLNTPSTKKQSSQTKKGEKQQKRNN
jgi:hypothetical protein